MADTYTKSLLEVLQGSLSVDKATAKEASTQLSKQLMLDSQSVPALFEIGVTHASEVVRSAAWNHLRKAVTFRKNKFWKAQTPELREQLKGKLLETIVAEGSAQIRPSAIGFLTVISHIELPSSGGWPALLPWLHALTVSTDASTREVGLQVVYYMMDTLVITPSSPMASTDGNVAQLIELLGRTMSEEVSWEARVWSVRALGRLSEFIELGEKENIAKFQTVVPGIMTTLNLGVEKQEKTSARFMFDVIEGLTLSECPLMTPHITGVLESLLNFSKNQSLDPSIRVMALDALQWIIRFKTAKCQSLEIAGPLLAALLPICAEPSTPAADESHPSTSRTALRIISALARSFPASQILPSLFEQVQQLATAADPNQRKAGVAAFGVVVEGCADALVEHLPGLWKFLQSTLTDSDVEVRKAACEALANVCEALRDEAAKQHEVLLPLFSNLLADATTVRPALLALDSFLEALEQDTIKPYLPTLVPALSTLLSTCPAPLRPSVVSCLGSAAHAAKSAYTEYFASTMQQVVPFLSLSDSEEGIDLRSISQDTIGTLAEAVGKETFAPFVEGTIQAAVDAMLVEGEDVTPLREASFGSFAVLAKVYGEEFATYLPTVMPILLETIQKNESDKALLGSHIIDLSNQVVNSDNESEDGDFADEDDSDFEDVDSDDGSTGDDEALFRSSTSAAVEKECAIDAVAEIFGDCQKPFLPYVEPVVKGLLEALKHPWHEGVRKSAVVALLAFVATVYTISDGAKWSKGAETTPLPSDEAQLISFVIPAILELWETEEESDIVEEICSSLADLLLIVGPQLVVPAYLETLCTRVEEILESKATCQILDDDADHEDDEEGLEADETSADLIGEACDLLGSLATSMGDSFAPLFEKFLPLMAKYADATNDLFSRACAVGSLGEIVNAISGPILAAHTSTLFPIFTSALVASDTDVRVNGAFAIGSLILRSDSDLNAEFLSTLGRLEPLFESEEEGEKDNAAGAVARMISKNVAAVPLEQVLPVLLKSLPLRRDFAESAPVFDALLSLLRSSNPIATSPAHLATILSLIGQALETVVANDAFYPVTEGAQLDEKTRKDCVLLINELWTSGEEGQAKVKEAGLQKWVLV